MGDDAMVWGRAAGLASGHELKECVCRLAASTPDAELAALVDETDEWSISLQAAQVLAGLVRHVGPESVLEFGAGRSSLVLACALQQSGGGRLTSIEHQPVFAEEAWRDIRRRGAVDAQLVPAGLALRPSRHGLLYQYTGITAALSSRGPYDFVFIDAPSGDFGRDSTLFAAAPFLASNALIVLDDAMRSGEQTALRRWERALPLERVFESRDVGRGIAVLTLARPARATFHWRTLLGTCHDRLHGLGWRWRRHTSR